MSRGVLACEVLLVLAAVASVGRAQSCAFRGSCHFNRDIRKSVPCAVDEAPSETLSDSLWKEFTDFCEDLAASLQDRRLCCEASQFETLKKEMKAAEAIGMKRCPGCYRAFKNLMCQMTCSPTQGQFIVVNATTDKPGSPGPIVQEIVYGLDKNFANTLYSTCNSARSNVVVKLTTLMCGAYGNRCNTLRFLNFLGAPDEEGGYSPFKIRHILHDEDIQVTDYRGKPRVIRKQAWLAADKCKIQ
ncbi:NPC intracellular cholesterol transporter 1 [Galendromus occidentalis]|uniref:NPC intracellular cholesterol transporter 1 n=1 Tax=Galendromus occidentalis TaxID=34638 RepID=A0AAJ6QLQ9_9ACAR|nr:NPC intracellular cholesterol transporter 1 [Galendromus occidentalis]